MNISDVISRMREIDDELPSDDGVAVFNHLYLTVTERIGAALEEQQVFEDPEFMTELDVRFARLYLDAYDAGDDRRSRAWAPLFEGRRRRGVLPIQFALAGMNTHIEHDLPVAVVSSCEAMGLSPKHRAVQRDYQAVNALLADVESEIRRSFLDEVQTLVDDQIGPVVHLVSSWKIDKARDVAWVTTETLWSVREVSFLRRAFLESLSLSVGMGSRLLLTPTGVPV
ncbi:MAG TPA: DUF5995 family protein [Nocardioidaceae bacterium]|nr:DUF5995 family protein [Nocardioidaceae bacterium]